MYSDLAPLSFPNEFQSRNDCYEDSRQFADLFWLLAKELSLPTQLREVKIQSSDVEVLAREAMKQTRLLPNNFRDVTHEDALRLYSDAF
jgi:alcohol dehydrogenase class IV